MMGVMGMLIEVNRKIICDYHGHFVFRMNVQDF